MKLSELVKKIIRENKVSRQQEIIDMLSEVYGIAVTQSNISRIFKQIHVAKVLEKNGVFYEIQEKIKETSICTESFVKSIGNNGSVIVINSYPGSASIIEQIISEKRISEVMGIISGSDAVLIIPKNLSEIKTLEEKIARELLRNVQ